MRGVRNDCGRNARLGDLRSLLADQSFWRPEGRVGVITKGKYANRLILSGPNPGHWTEVVSSSREEGPLDSYIVTDEYAANVLEEYEVAWLARSKRGSLFGGDGVRLAADV